MDLLRETASTSDRATPRRNLPRRVTSAVGRSVWNQVLLFLAVIVAVYFVIPDPGLAIAILAMGLWAASLNLLIGYGGLISFGHALPFAYGGYAAGLIILHVNPNFWLALVAGIMVPGIVSVFVGYISLRRTYVYLAMLTLAFAQLGYFIALQARSITGGADGLSIPEPAVLTLPGFSVEMNAIGDPNTFYLVTAVIVLAVFAFLVLFTDSPLGRALQATRENEERTRACGYNTRLIKLITFVTSSMVAGLAGALFALSNLFVGLQPYWLLSGTVVIMVILGGRSTLFGSVLGALTYLVLEHYLSREFGHWQIIVGAIFVACVLLFPQGLWGLVRLEGLRGIRRAGASSKKRETEA